MARYSGWLGQRGAEALHRAGERSRGRGQRGALIYVEGCDEIARAIGAAHVAGSSVARRPSVTLVRSMRLNGH